MAKSRFQSLLEQKLVEAIAVRTNALATGNAEDYAAYKLEVGYLLGLDAALKLCEEIERESE